MLQSQIHFEKSLTQKTAKQNKHKVFFIYIFFAFSKPNFIFSLPIFHLLILVCWVKIIANNGKGKRIALNSITWFCERSSFNFNEITCLSLKSHAWKNCGDFPIFWTQFPSTFLLIFAFDWNWNGKEKKKKTNSSCYIRRFIVSYVCVENISVSKLMEFHFQFSLCFHFLHLLSQITYTHNATVKKVKRASRLKVLFYILAFGKKAMIIRWGISNTFCAFVSFLCQNSDFKRQMRMQTMRKSNKNTVKCSRF